MNEGLKADRAGGFKPLGLGCMRFPKSAGGIDMDKTEKLIIRAVELGVDYFDTAYVYQGSEDALGQILEKTGLRGKIKIATKLPHYLVKNPQDIDKFFNRQLSRLRTGHIEYYLIHFMTDLDSWEKLCRFGIKEWIEKNKSEGKIGKIGFSFHGTRESFIKLIDAYDWDFCQIQYNYSDENYQAGVQGLKYAASKGIPVIIMEPLLGGRLVNGLPSAAIECFRKADPSLSPAAWALRWLWNQPEVSCVLSGMNSLEQLEENVKTAAVAQSGVLSDEEKTVFKRVKAIMDISRKVNCTGCGYCMPCPYGVNIPGCFSAYNSFYAIGRSSGRQQYMMSSGFTAKNRSYASLCKKCGRCEKHCPQNISIMSELEKLSAVMEPFWFKPFMFFAKLFMGNK